MVLLFPFTVGETKAWEYTASKCNVETQTVQYSMDCVLLWNLLHRVGSACGSFTWGKPGAQEVFRSGETEYPKTQLWSWVRMHNRLSRCPNPQGRWFLGAEHPLQLSPRAALTGLANSGTSPVWAALTTNTVLPQRPGSTPDRPCLNRQLTTAGAGSAERAGSQGCSECRCLSLNAQSCKSEHPDWCELKAWCSVPINSTVYCQSSLDWQSSTHQFKWAFVVIEDRSVRWIPIKAYSLSIGSILRKALDTFQGSNSYRNKSWDRRCFWRRRWGKLHPLLIGSLRSLDLPSTFLQWGVKVKASKGK